MSIRRISNWMSIMAVTLSVAGTASLATSCGSSRRNAVAVEQKKHPRPVKRPRKAGPAAHGDVAKALVDEAETWLGVPYVWGGETREGADCSGFLKSIYATAAGIDLPRTTRQQMEACAPVDRDKVSVGDILFFSSKRSGGEVAHVGMYIGGGRMIHASSSRGVVEDEIGLKYYTDHYLGTGRVPMIADATPAVKEQREKAAPLDRGIPEIKAADVGRLMARAEVRNQPKAAAENVATVGQSVSTVKAPRPKTVSKPENVVRPATPVKAAGTITLEAMSARTMKARMDSTAVRVEEPETVTLERTVAEAEPVSATDPVAQTVAAPRDSVESRAALVVRNAFGNARR